MKRPGFPGLFSCQSCLGQQEAQPRFDWREGQRNQFITQFPVDADQRMIGALGLIERLLALLILREDLRSRRGEEDAWVVADVLGGGADVLWHRQAAQPEIAKRVGYAAIEEHRPLLFDRVPI